MIGREWLYLCLKRDIPKCSFKAFDMFGACLVGYTGNDGRIKVARNICAHRGFRIFEGEGEFKNPRCPYHGLPFNPEKGPEQFEVFESGEAVFISKPVAGEDTRIKPLFPVVLGEEFGFLTQKVKAPFHLWMQNTADPNHLKTVHPETFTRLFASYEARSEAFETNYSAYSMDLNDDVVRRYERYFIQEPNPWHDWGFTHMMFYPHLSVTSFLGVFFSVETAIPTPEDESSTSVYTRFFVAPESKVPRLLKKMAMENNFTILQEDKDIVERWANQYNNEPGFFLKGEDRIKHYLAWLKIRGLFDE